MKSIELGKTAKAFGKKVLPTPVVKKVQAYRRRDAKPPIEPDTYRAVSTYTVVSAVYNVEKYLGSFFKSIRNQTMTKDTLRIVMVDDGSTDSSPDIIREWQNRMPGIISYFRKENEGQASARNLGLRHVDTEWVCFIDPDDYVSKKYFENVDKAIAAWPGLKMVSCNTILYKESATGKGEYQNRHPLRSRFKEGDSFFAVGDEGMHIQLSASSVFFRSDVIRENSLEFSEKIKPNFEDGHFVGRYLLALDNGVVGFLKEPRYYYRKRFERDSTLDNSWNSLDKMITVPKYGYLNLLKAYSSKMGFVPRNIQRTVLYDYSWYLKRYLGHPEKTEWVLRSGIADDMFETWKQIFSMIDLDAIMTMPGSNLSYDKKYATAKYFLHAEKLPYRILYLHGLNLKNKTMQIEYAGEGIDFFLDGRNIHPIDSKRVSHTFFRRNLYCSTVVFISFESPNQVLSFRSAKGETVKLSVRDKQWEESIVLQTLIDGFTLSWSEYPQIGDTWLIMDRDTQPDDNGEHFCRYMIENHPEQRVLFALRKEAPQYQRLMAEGFPLVEFGSAEYEKELRACSKIISSHADAFVHSYFRDNFNNSKQFVFLQHGITANDLSAWLNPKPIDLMVTAVEAEYESIVSDGSPYRLCKSQTVLTGFPRHDALLRKASGRQGRGRTIAIMPTWRNSLVGAKTGDGNGAAHELSDIFTDSRYKAVWESVLSCDALKALADDGCKLAFFPHANMLPYIEAGLFCVPDYVEIGTCALSSIQDYFVQSDLCITDYSSTAYEFAYLGKPVVYYQFDREEFFGGSQVFAKGYFDYERDGFGPVVTTQGELERAIVAIARNSFAPDGEYRTRMRAAFPFRDGKCCERVYQAIMEIDRPKC